MPAIIPERRTAVLDGDFVVFLIGMRINKPWKLHKWGPVALAMPRMLTELYKAGPASGFLGHTGLGLMSMVQYWRSFEALEAYARSRDHAHWPAWVAFNKAMHASRGDVGIWHETYRAGPGTYETVYSGMPPHGLGRVGTLLDAAGARDAAAGRMGKVAEKV